MKVSHCGDIHVEEDRYFEDAAQCLKWFVEDSICANTNLFVVDGDLTTYKTTIKERNLWVDSLVRMANHAPVILVAGNHGAETANGVRGSGWISMMRITAAIAHRNSMF